MRPNIIDHEMQCNTSEIGARLKSERQRMGWTREVMAAAGGVSKASQAAYEAGVRVPDSRYLCRLAPEGVDVEYLICGYRHSERFAAEVRWELLTAIAEQIEAWSKDSGLAPLERGRREWLIRRLYDIQEKRPVNVEEIRSVLAFVAFGSEMPPQAVGRQRN
ncbi:MAG: XRE family transcriptional regulator [Alphaproteobacteria bacterium]|nr:XRE family transcriptional regulator [Alphaproteobacteria bacterium]